jgi:diphosphomevalonate decarboxylase
MMKKQQIVSQLLKGREKHQPEGLSSAYAPSNIALCKYWGKRDRELNLPVNSSLSISLASLGCTTVIKVIDAPEDQVILNGETLEADAVFSTRVSAYLDLFRQDHHFEINTQNTIPTAAGLASSASGFAALAEALNGLFNWQCDEKTLSILARLGSGSACRSIYHGFVAWDKGERDDGLDSFATQIPSDWTDLRLGVLLFDKTEKAISSREAMQRSVETSCYFNAWELTAQTDFEQIKSAIKQQDFRLLGETSERNALAMHATMLTAKPPVCYWQASTLAAMQRVWALRADGVDVYFTEDAGPNLKLLFEKSSLQAIKAAFPDLIIVEPLSHHV